LGFATGTNLQKFFVLFSKKNLLLFSSKVHPIPRRWLGCFRFARQMPKLLGPDFRATGLVPELKGAFTDFTFGQFFMLGHTILL
jgi:hypothetical protein